MKYLNYLGQISFVGIDDIRKLYNNSEIILNKLSEYFLMSLSLNKVKFLENISIIGSKSGKITIKVIHGPFFYDLINLYN